MERTYEELFEDVVCGQMCFMVVVEVGVHVLNVDVNRVVP